MSEVKQFLYSVRNEAREIKEIRQRIEDLELQASGLTGISYDKVSVQTSPHDSMADQIIEMVKYKDLLSSKIGRLNLRRAKAQGLIDSLADSRERQVLDLYFLDDRRLSMNAVAREISYSERETYLIYQLALSHLCSDLQ